MNQKERCERNVKEFAPIILFHHKKLLKTKQTLFRPIKHFHFSINFNDSEFI